MGVNVIFGVSFVVVKVVVDFVDLLLFCYLGGLNVYVLFVLLFNVINGGEYVDNGIDM